MGSWVTSRAETRTVLFTDLRDSTAQRVLLGDDTFDELRREHDRVLTAAVTLHGGHIVKSTGDGVHTAFGAASSALACASAMQQGIDRLNRAKPSSEHLSLAIGMSAGDVVAEVGDIYGTPVIEAARLCAAAHGGQILVADVVRLLAGTRGAYEFVARGEVTLRGLATPVRTYEALWHAPMAPPIPLPNRLAPAAGDFVGRVSEREQLMQAFKEAETRPGQFVVVVGEAGIGKSRLAREVAATMHAAGAVVLAGRCEENLGGPFQPWVGALGHLIAHLPTEAIVEHVAEHGAEIARVVPEVLRRCPDTTILARSDTDSERHRLFEAIAALLRRAATDLPLVILLDDLQWADVPTLQLLRHLVRVAEPAPLLLIGTYRDAGLDRSPLAETLTDLRRDNLFTRIVLRGFSEDELDQFLATRLVHPPPADFVSALYAETEGNPFFAGEVLAHLVETNLISELAEPGAAETMPLTRLGISAGVHVLLGQRMARLPHRSTQALEAASVIGREFDLTTLAALCQGTDDELLESLGQAVRAGLIREDPTHHDRFTFTHALVRQALYGDLGTTRRVRMHWRAGTELQASQTHDVDAVAFHLAEGVLAGDTLQAVDATLVAGARALAMSAFEMAIDQFERALGMLDQTRPGQLTASQNDRQYAALVGLGDAHLALTNVAGYTQAFLAAAAVARADGRADRLARVALGLGAHAQIVRLAPETAALFDEAIEALGTDDSAERSLLLSYRAFHRTLTPGLAEDRHADVDEAAAIAGRLGDRRAAAQAMFVQASALRGSSRVDEILELTAPLMKVAVDLDDVMLQTHALLMSGTAHLQRGDRHAWQRSAAALKSLARRPDASYAGAFSRLWDTIELIFDERYADAEHAASAGAEAWHTLPVAEVSFRSQQWNLLRWRGQHEAAIELLKPWLDVPGVAATLRTTLACLALDENPARHCAEVDHYARDDFASVGLQAAQRPWVIANLADLCARTCATAHAPAIGRLLEPYSGQMLIGPSTVGVHGAADTALARIASLQRQWDAADGLFRRGIALEEHVGAPMLASTSRLWYAEHLCRSGSEPGRRKALHLLDGCLAHFGPIGYYLTDRAMALRRQFA